MPRPYNKKSNYWTVRKNLSKLPAQANTVQQVIQERVKTPDITYSFPDEEKSYSKASQGGSTDYQTGLSSSIFPINPFPNIAAGILPWETMGSNNYLSLSLAITLCQRAYANVSIFRNAIEGAVEFSNSIIHIKTSNQTVKDFFTSWFDKVDMYKLKENFFREYYRSGNVFLYRFNGHIDQDQFGRMKTVFGAKSSKLPIRYTLLNPAQIYLISGISYNNNYVKALSRYEIERLKTPLTDEDKQVYNSLPQNVKSLIQSGGSFREVFIPLDRERLRFAFYKKQDYEPLALPFGFPILNDLEYKLDLKKMDMSLSKTVDHAILLITNGEKVDQYGGGINPRNIEGIQSIFQNRTLGRVLVADYSTKGKWLIPDISAILGPEKYEQVEKDIRVGLASIFSDDGNDKLGNALVRARAFVGKLAAGRRAFLNDFLMPEVKEICNSMGFRDVPDLEFQQIDLEDNSQRERVIMRLYELGAISPNEVLEAIQSGILPDMDTNIINQKLYKPLKDNDLFQPLMSKQNDGGDGRPPGSGSPQTTKNVKPAQKTAKANIENKFSMIEIAKISNLAENIKDTAINKLKNKFNLSELNESQIAIANDIVKALMINEEVDKWNNLLDSYIIEPKEVKKDAMAEITKLSDEYELSPWQSIIVSKSKLV